MRPYIVMCQSGRSFVVYAPEISEARRFFLKMMPLESVREIGFHVIDHTIACVDERKAPGA